MLAQVNEVLVLACLLHSTKAGPYNDRKGGLLEMLGSEVIDCGQFVNCEDDSKIGGVVDNEEGFQRIQQDFGSFIDVDGEMADRV